MNNHDLDLNSFLHEAFRDGGHYARLADQSGRREAHRPHQLAYARHIGTALQRENIAVNDVTWPAIGLIQADTGIGKTRVLLTAAAFLGMTRELPVVLSTFTRALQHQMLNGNDWKFVQTLFQSLFNHTPTMAVRFGRGNFIAESLVRSWEDERIKHGAESNPEWDALVNYLASVRKSGDPLDATIATFREKNGDQLPVIPHGHGEKRLVDADIALRSKHEEGDQAFYLAHLSNMTKNPDIILTNHNSVVLDALLDGKLFLPSPDRRAALIVDEADHLHPVAQNVLARRVRVSQHMRQAAKVIGMSLQSQHDLPDDKRNDALNTMKQLDEKAEFMDATLHDVGETFEWCDMAITQSVMDANDDLAKCIRMPATTIKTIRGFLKSYAGQDHHRSALEDIVDELTRVALKEKGQQDVDVDTDDDGALRFLSWSPTRRHAAFCEERISANWLVFKVCGRAFKKEKEQADGTTTTIVYGVREKESNPCVLTSATLVSPYLTDLEHYRRENRFPAVVADTQEVVDVAHFGRASFVLPAPGISGIWLPKTEKSELLKYNPEWTDMVTSVLRHLANKKRRTLVLTPSFSEVSMFGELLSDVDVAFHTDGAFRDYWSAFLAGDQSVVVTPSAWEGFNPVEDGVTWCQDVVITRVPMAPRNDLVDGERARIMAQSNAEWVKKVKESGQMRTKDLRPMTISTAHYLLQQDRVACAYRRLVQAMGRGIRDANDRCRIWILDPRMPMGSAVMDAMERSENPDILDLVEKVENMEKPMDYYAAIRAALPPRLSKSYSTHDLWFQGAVVDICAEALEGVN